MSAAEIAGTTPPSHESCDSGPSVVLLQGGAGTGKTSLVDELQMHVLEQRGLFTRVKFDQLKRNSNCVLYAFRYLVLHLLMCDPVAWRARLQHALGENAQVLVDVIPELARLLGRHSPVPALSAVEAASRLQMVLVQFVSCV